MTVLSRSKGQSAEFFGREYHVHSCDDFTRRWLQGEGVQLGANDEQPPSTTPEPDDAPTKTPAQGRRTDLCHTEYKC